MGAWQLSQSTYIEYGCSTRSRPSSAARVLNADASGVGPAEPAVRAKCPNHLAQVETAPSKRRGGLVSGVQAPP